MTKKPGDVFAAGFAIFCVLSFFWVLGESTWNSAVKPTLGYFGIIEYKTKNEARYESFLNRTSNCKEEKKIYSEKSSKYPVFHLFKCPNGSDLIWKYKIKVIRKIDETKWLLEE
jgi:hypothetical protein